MIAFNALPVRNNSCQPAASALLHLLFMLRWCRPSGANCAMAPAAQWQPDLAAVAGKAAPYLIAFMLWGRGGDVLSGRCAGLGAGGRAGAAGDRLFGRCYLAYAWVPLLLLGVTPLHEPEPVRLPGL